jgi:hypothetical protein
MLVLDKVVAADDVNGKSRDDCGTIEAREFLHRID